MSAVKAFPKMIVVKLAEYFDIVPRLQQYWGTQKFVEYTTSLLLVYAKEDGSSREGFDLTAFMEIQTLLDLHNETFPLWKPISATLRWTTT
jgi:hypothetical protein